MKTATAITFIKLNKEEIGDLIETVQEKPGYFLYQGKRFTVPDLWNIHRQRRSFERRSVFSR